MSFHEESFSEVGRSNLVYRNTLKFYARIWTICLGSFCVGFTQVYYSIMIAWYKIDQTHSSKDQWNGWKYDIIGAILPFTAILASTCIFFQKYLSRRHLLMLGGLLGIIGSILSIFAYIYKGDDYIFNTPLIIIGRIFHGVTIAIFMTFCLVIINQYSPNQLKLTAICIHQISIEFGIFITTVTYPSAKILLNISWNNLNILMQSLAIPIFVLQISLIAFIFKQEPPVYLLQNNKERQARSLISTIYENQYVDQKLLQFKHEATIKQGTFFEEYDQKQVWRKGLMLGLFAIAVKQLSGIKYITSIKPHFQRQLQLSQIFYDSIPNGFQFLGTIALILFSWSPKLKKFICKSNRKILIQTGSFLSFICLLVISILELLIKYGKIGHINKNKIWIAIECPYLFIYGFTLGPIVYVYISQMLKSRQIQLCLTFYWILAFFESNVLSIVNRNDKYLGIVPGALSICCILLFLIGKWYLIETKNKSYSQIVRDIDVFHYCPCGKKQ